MNVKKRRLTRSAMATVEDCERLWEKLWTKGRDAVAGNIPRRARGTGEADAESWRHWAEGSNCRKPKGDLIRPGGSLGLALRLILIRDFLNLGADEFFAKAARQSARRLSPGKANTISGNEKRALQLGSNRSVGDGTSLYLDGILKLVNEERARLPQALNRLPSEDDLFASQFAGSQAVDEFRRMLRRAYAGPQPLIAPQKFLTDNDEPRKRLSDTVLEIVRATGTGTPGQPMLLNVYSTLQWSGLSAFASWLPEAVRREDSREVLVIPLSRRPPPPSAPRDGHPEPTRAPILNFSEIIGILRAFVHKGTHAVSGASALRDQDGLYDVIQDIRIRLARQPAILIFDGYYESGVEPRDLERRVADDLLDGLLRRLLEPPLSGIKEPIDLGHFRRNLIVVTSNNRLRLVDQAPLVPGAGRARAEELLRPVSGNFNAVLGEQNFQQPEITAKLMRDRLWSGLPVDFGYLVDGYAGIHKSVFPQEDTKSVLSGRLGRISAGASVSTAVSYLVGALLRDLKAWRPAWYDIICLVALAPDGLRRETIWRLALHARTLDDEMRPVPDIARLPDWAALDREVTGLLAAAQSILGLNHDDAFEGVDDLPHPLEFGTISFAESALGTIRSSRSIDILVPEIKHAIRSKWVEGLRGKRLQYHAAYRLLAEDALQQQTISLRHVDGSSLQSPRPWRRMLSALFHGLQSLPIETNEHGEAAGISEINFGRRDLLLGRSAPAFWRFLYAFCYRRMIERPPAWNLSRLYGLDELKLEMLDCFDRPWQLWPEALQPKPADNSLGLFELCACKPGGEVLAEDYRLSRAQALIAAGQLEAVASALVPATASSIREKPSARQLKRLVDVDLLLGCRDLRPELTGHLVDRLGDAHARIDNHIDVTTHTLLDLVANGSGPDEHLNSGLQSALEVIVTEGESAGWSARDYSDICDLYFRIAEHYAMVADLDDAEEQKEQPTNGPRDAGRAPEDIDYRFCRSLAIYRFAEQLRLRNFELRPLGGQFFASGHVARVSIRVALKLEVRARQLAPAGRDGAPGLGVFARYARRMADTLTRHLFRYPRERASQLILEASMLRLLTPPGSDRELEHLLLARTYLSRAETLVLGLGRKARVRMRLAFERAKVNRRLAKGMQGRDDRLRSRYLEHASYDVEVISALAGELGLKLWERLAEIQKQRIRIETANG